MPSVRAPLHHPYSGAMTLVEIGIQARTPRHLFLLPLSLALLPLLLLRIRLRNPRWHRLPVSCGGRARPLDEAAPPLLAQPLQIRLCFLVVAETLFDFL